MKYLKQLLTAALVVSALLVVVVCGEKTVDSQAPAKPTPAKLTAADLQKLRWIQGTWRGTGGEKPFFERYRFENATTLAVDSFENEKLEKVTDTTLFELKTVSSVAAVKARIGSSRPSTTTQLHLRRSPKRVIRLSGNAIQRIRGRRF